MATWLWIVIAIGALLVLGMLVFGAFRARESAQRREQAHEIRQEAETHTRHAEEREQVAREQEEHARDARRVAAEVGARADRLDPGRDEPDRED